MAQGLVLDHISISLGGQTLLSMNAVVQPGQVLTVMGPSGSGKSTLLRFLAGVLGPPFTSSGRILLDGRDLCGVPLERRRIGILFQDDLLFPHLSVGGNLLFGLEPGLGRPERRGRVEAALEEVGLAGFFDRDPATLSGGQRARVSLLRVLLSQPLALLLDEPLSKLDVALRQQVRAQLFAKVRSRHLPAVLVTHDPEDAAAAGGPVIYLGEPRHDQPPIAALRPAR